MGKKIAILQSNYIPWKGYFDLINQVDEFILFDDVQYTKNDWRNRNILKTRHGLQWLTIPVLQKKLAQSIKETKIADMRWAKKHWKSITASYAKTPYFQAYKEFFEDLYLNTAEHYLSIVNYRFLAALCSILNIKPLISYSTDYNLVAGKTERIVDLCNQSGANEYVSGPAARNYLDENLFRQENIKLSYINYSGYPEYPQMFGAFEHGVSILDLVFNEGPNAHKYMKSFYQNKL